jgi:type II secretory ATPase GspE/PulE/Tfp pilus assembly ATPase PilB-like protein
MGRHSMFFEHREIDLRFSSHPTIFGESIVVRILDKHLKPLNITELEFDEVFASKLSSLIKIPYGLIIFTGPTGSGKTTTLFSILNQMNESSVNIMTLEDPVEYILDGAKQTEIKPGTIEEFNEGVRSILRQDPDVILIGEMRDEETARMAFRAAMTGHKVFSTLHANTSFQVIQRLRDLNVPLSLISGNLKGIVSQRLLRKICHACQGTGCVMCHTSGFLGRVPAGEMMMIDGCLDEMIARGDPLHSMEKYALSVGFVPLKEYAMNMVKQGLTTLNEVEKVVSW